MVSIDIYSYFDYPRYLADYYKARRALEPAFSHRAFLKVAEITGSMYLQRVITRQRKLSPKFVEHFIRALGISGKQAAYFRLLVRYGNEKRPIAKQTILKEMLSLRTKDGHRIENRKLRYFEKWYYPVIRELAAIIDFKDNFALLANSVEPRISPVQAEYAVKYLLENKFLKKDQYRNYSQIDSVLTTGPEVNSTILAGFHRKNLLLAADAVDSVSRMERDVSSLTLGVSRETYGKIKQEIQHFRKRLLKLAGTEKKPAMVCHVGFQLLPRSRLSRKKGGQ